jgi:hypothetical protein
MTLEEIADRYKVDAGWLRSLVGRSHLQPTRICQRPTRRYYSLLNVGELVRKSRRGEPH